MQQKQKLFPRDGLLILKDKSSNIAERSLFTLLCKIYQEQGLGIISSHDNKLFYLKLFSLIHTLLFSRSRFNSKKGVKKKVQNHSIFGVKFTPALLTPFLE